MIAFAPGSLRRVARPTEVLLCPLCGLATGGGYASCARCFDAVERFWLADWRAALESQGMAAGTEDERLLAEVALAEAERWPWSVVDRALTFLVCPECGGERGGGPVGCTACADAYGAALGSEQAAARQGPVTMNEHALHIGRFILRHPHRYPPDSVIGWRLTMPRLLTGWLPSTPEAQRMGRLIKQGRMDEVHAGLRAVDEGIRALSAARAAR